VGTPGGLEIDLIWDSSVRSATNWSSIEQAVISAAKIYTADFANPITLNIQVGFGEADGSALPFGATGESITNGDYVNYSYFDQALTNADATLAPGAVAAGLNALPASALAANSTSFFVASAEEKALGFTSSYSVDGYIGLAQGSTLAFSGTIGARQYDAVGVAAHEISEVMGRIGMEGSAANGGHYTPLDLFRYSAATNQPAPSLGAGTYFSTTLGVGAPLNSYNNPTNGGDSADWATTSANTDAYNAFGAPGVTTQVTATDLLEVAVLGYKPVGALTTVTA
jgi:hypothetical protein